MPLHDRRSFIIKVRVAHVKIKDHLSLLVSLPLRAESKKVAPFLACATDFQILITPMYLPSIISTVSEESRAEVEN